MITDDQIGTKLHEELAQIHPPADFRGNLLRAVDVTPMRRRMGARWVAGVAAAAAVLGAVTAVSANALLNPKHPAANVPSTKVIPGLPSPGTPIDPGAAYVVTGPPPVEHDQTIDPAAAPRFAGYPVLTLAGMQPIKVEYVTYSSPALPDGWKIVIVPHIRLTYATSAGTVVLFENRFDRSAHPNGIFTGPGNAGSTVATHNGGQYILQVSDSGAIDQVSFATNATVVSVTFTPGVTTQQAWRVVDALS